MNEVIISGVVDSGIEWSVTNGGKDLAKFQLALNLAESITVVAMGDEAAQNLPQPGQAAVVTGRLTERWTKDESTGDWSGAYEVFVQRIATIAADREINFAIARGTVSKIYVPKHGGIKHVTLSYDDRGFERRIQVSGRPAEWDVAEGDELVAWGTIHMNDGRPAFHAKGFTNVIQPGDLPVAVGAGAPIDENLPF